MLSGKKPNKGDDTLSSSPTSTTSCDIFGECSDYSDCGYCDKYPQVLNCLPSHCNIMGKMEKLPLLRATSSPVTTYRALVPSDSSDTLGAADISSTDILELCNNQYEKNDVKCRKQNSLVTIFSVWNTVMGSSLLTMAWGVGRAGLPAALLLLAAMSALCLFTAHLLIRLAAKHGGSACEVPALCRALLGRGAEGLAHVFSLLVLLGATVVYWILLTNFLFFTVNYAVDFKNSNATEYNTTVLCPKYTDTNRNVTSQQKVENAYWGLHTTVPIYVALIIFPLLNFQNVSFFTNFNSLGTLSVLYLVVFVLVKSVGWELHAYRSFGENKDYVSLITHNEGVLAGVDHEAGWDAAALSGMLALSFYIHNIIITIMSNNRNQAKNGRDLSIAFALVTLTYSLVGAVFYVCFPLAQSCIEDNILNNFEIHDAMSAVARALLLFQVVTVYPLVAFMLRSEAILLLPIAQELKSRRSVTVITNVIIVIVCILFACFCPDIGTIIRYTGAVSGMVHVFTLPALLQLRSLQLRGEINGWKLIFYASIIAFGVFNLLVQFFIR